MQILYNRRLVWKRKRGCYSEDVVKFFHHQTPPSSFHLSNPNKRKNRIYCHLATFKRPHRKERTPYIQQQRRRKKEERSKQQQGRRKKSIHSIITIMLPHLKIARVLRTSDLALQKFILMKCHLLQAEGEDQQAYQDDAVAACIGFNTQAHLLALLQHVIFLEVQLTGRRPLYSSLSPPPSLTCTFLLVPPHTTTTTTLTSQCAS